MCQALLTRTKVRTTRRRSASRHATPAASDGDPPAAGQGLTTGSRRSSRRGSSARRTPRQASPEASRRGAGEGLARGEQPSREVNVMLTLV